MPEILNKRTLSIALIIVFVSVTIGFLYNWMLPDSLSLIYEKKIIKSISDSLLFGNNNDGQSLNDNNIVDNKFTKNRDSSINIENNGTVKIKNPDSSLSLTTKNNLKNTEVNPKIEKKIVSDLNTVTYEQLLRVIQSDDFVIIDARRNEEYLKGHIPNSINIFALDDPNQKVPKIYDIPQGKKIIVYCDGGNCDLSHELAKELKGVFGFKEVFLYEGGWEEWSQKYKK